MCRRDHVLTHIHSIYLHHDSLPHLAPKKQTTEDRWGGGVGGAMWQVSSTLPVTVRHFLEEQTARNTNFPVKRLFFWGKVWEVLLKTP